MKKMFIWLLLFSQQLSATELIDNYDWKLKKSEQGIEVFDAGVPNSKHLAVLAKTIIDAEAEQIQDLLRMPKKCSEWVYRCSSSRLYKRVGTDIDFVYTQSKMPFVIKDRHILAEIRWQTNPNSGLITGHAKAINEAIEASQHYVQIQDAEMIWELMPLSDGTTQVRSFAHVDPAGAIPVWLSNQLSTNIPIKTLTSLKKMIEEKP